MTPSLVSLCDCKMNSNAGLRNEVEHFLAVSLSVDAPTYAPSGTYSRPGKACFVSVRMPAGQCARRWACRAYGRASGLGPCALGASVPAKVVSAIRRQPLCLRPLSRSHTQRGGQQMASLAASFGGAWRKCAAQRTEDPVPGPAVQTALLLLTGML